MASCQDFEQPETADALLTAIAVTSSRRGSEKWGRALSFGPDALPGPGPVATQDATSTNPESQGFCVPSCVPSATNSGGEAVCLSGNGSPELGTTAEMADRTRVSEMLGRMEPFSKDFARSLRPASMARCTGSSGGFASYRRDPLLGTYRDGGVGDQVRAVKCVPRLDPNPGC